MVLRKVLLDTQKLIYNILTKINDSKYGAIASMNDLDKLRFCGVLKNKVFAGPKTVSMHITNKCNLSCIYCWYYSPLKNDRSFKGSKIFGQKIKEVDYNFFKEIIDDCCELKVERIQLSAQGEPSMHSRFVDMLDYIKGKGFIISLVTNGTFEKKLLKHLLKVDEITIDFSASNPHLYRKIQSHTTKDFFSTVMRNISFFSELKNKKKKTPYIKVNYILTSKNYKDLPQFFKLISKFKIDYLNVLNMDPSEHNLALSLTKELAEKINSIINKISKNEYCSKIKSNLWRNKKLFNRFLNKLNLTPIRPVTCFNGWYYAFITLNGDVTPCCKMKKQLIAGNIYQDSFKTIWHSKAFAEIRNSGKINLYNHRFKTCDSCCFYKLNQEIYERLNHKSQKRMVN